MKKFSICALIVLLPLLGAHAADVLFSENFTNLSHWKEVFFPKIPAHTHYTAAHDGPHTFLKAESHASASLLVYKDTFNPYTYPRVSWRWKVEQYPARSRSAHQGRGRRAYPGLHRLRL